MNSFVMAGLSALMLGAAFWVLFRKVLSPARGQIEIRRLRDFSAAQYRPMTRLLSEEDFLFLRRQPGYEAGIEKRLRAQRRRVFRAYLDSLTEEFQALHRAVRALIVNAPVDQPGLASAIVKQSLYFHFALAAIEFRLMLHVVGIGGVQVDVAPVVESVRQMQDQFLNLIPRPAAAVSS
ncbi:MAG: hypothetical protein FJW20_24720 [Acidimicrobiia bacterium]|nr:hypothetical protein [Acidimicrobiia bacterium]